MLIVGTWVRATARMESYELVSTTCTGSLRSGHFELLLGFLKSLFADFLDVAKITHNKFDNLKNAISELVKYFFIYLTRSEDFKITISDHN